MLGALFTAAQAETRVPWRYPAAKSCLSTTVCTMEFPVVAANRRVELEHFSCRLQVEVGELFEFSLYTFPAPQLFHYAVQVWTRDNEAGEHVFNFSEPTALFASAGQRFHVAVGISQNADIGLSCSLYGDLVFLP